MPRLSVEGNSHDYLLPSQAILQCLIQIFYFGQQHRHLVILQVQIVKFVNSPISGGSAVSWLSDRYR